MKYESISLGKIAGVDALYEALLARRDVTGEERYNALLRHKMPILQAPQGVVNNLYLECVLGSPATFVLNGGPIGKLQQIATPLSQQNLLKGHCEKPMFR